MPQCSVLLVEDDLVALEELAEALRGADLPCISTTRGDDALVRLKSDKRIGVVVSDIRLPDIDGLSMMAAAHAAMPARRLKCIVITGQPDYQAAVRALRLQAVDFLTKPLDVERLVAVVSASAAEVEGLRPVQGEGAAQILDRASSPACHPVASLVAPTEVDRLDRPGRVDATTQSLDADGAALRHRLLIMRLMRVQSLREKFLAPGLFSDPCWEILLDVLVHQLAGRPVSASSVYLATGVSATTAMRRLQDLEAAGLLRRYSDPHDQRRVLVEVTEGAAKRVARYLDLLMSAFSGDLAVSGPAPAELVGAPGMRPLAGVQSVVSEELRAALARRQTPP